MFQLKFSNKKGIQLKMGSPSLLPQFHSLWVASTKNLVLPALIFNLTVLSQSCTNKPVSQFSFCFRSSLSNYGTISKTDAKS